MSGNKEETSFLKNGVVDNYFAIKLLEARRDGNKDYEQFLVASQQIWSKRRTLHLGMAQSIHEWHKESERLNQLMDTQNLYRPDLRKRTRVKNAMTTHTTNPLLDAILIFVMGSLLISAITCGVLRIDWAASTLFGLNAVVSSYALLRIFRYRRTLHGED